MPLKMPKHHWVDGSAESRRREMSMAASARNADAFFFTLCQ
jgi:hypothetical protein